MKDSLSHSVWTVWILDDALWINQCISNFSIIYSQNTSQVFRHLHDNISKQHSDLFQK